MYQKKVAEDIRCPLEYGLKMFSGKWESRVLCVLNQKQSLRYSELRKELGDVTDAILADTLKKMMQNQLLERHSYGNGHSIRPHSLGQCGLFLL